MIDPKLFCEFCFADLERAGHFVCRDGWREIRGREIRICNDCVRARVAADDPEIEHKTPPLDTPANS